MSSLLATDRQSLRQSTYLADGIVELIGSGFYTVGEICELVRQSMWDMNEHDIRLSWLPLAQQFAVVRSIVNRLTKSGILERALGSNDGREVLSWNCSPNVPLDI